MRQGVTLITGLTGSGKTELVATLAEDYLWPKYKKVLRIYNTDGGAWGNKVTKLVKVGIIQVWRLRTRWSDFAEGLVEETLLRASQGWWPETFTDPSSGETEPMVTLLPPLDTQYYLFCKQKHLVTSGPVQKGMKGHCSACNMEITFLNGMVKVESKPSPEFAMVGGVAFEGLTSMSKAALDSLADRTTTTSGYEGDSSLRGSPTGKVVSGAVAFGGNSKQHYGMVHGQIGKWLHSMSTIPNLVVDPVITGLETTKDNAEDADAGEMSKVKTEQFSLVGPQVVGRAITFQIPTWVGNYLGTQRVVDEKGQRFRLCFKRYTDPDGTRHIYKVRTEAGTLPDYWEDKSDSGDDAHVEHNLGKFFVAVDEALEVALKEGREKFSDAPGLPEYKPRPKVEVKGNGAPVPRPQGNVVTPRVGPVIRSSVPPVVGVGIKK